MAAWEQSTVPTYEAASTTAATWTTPQENFLIDLMHDKVIECGANRVVGHFNKLEWSEFMQKFYARFRLKYDKKCFKNKVNNLKDRWRDFTKLRRDTTGLGWDEVLYTVDASQEWWSEYLKTNPRAKRFRIHGCPEFPKLQLIFSGTIATGNLRASQNSEFNSTDDEVNENSPESIPETQDPTTPGVLSDDVSERDRTQKRSNTPTTRPRRKRRDSQGSELNDTLKRLVGTSEARVELKTKNTITDCITVLDSMGTTIGKNTYMHAIKILQEKIWREAFLAFTPERRKEWLDSIDEGFL